MCFQSLSILSVDFKVVKGGIRDLGGVLVLKQSVDQKFLFKETPAKTTLYTPLS